VSKSLKIEVGMGEGVVAEPPAIITTAGLGSCVAVALYDRAGKRGGLAHIMLPGDAPSKRDTHNDNLFHYAESALSALISGLAGKGSRRESLVAKLAGGARMYSCDSYIDEGIGERNVYSIREILKREGIAITGSDTGGSYGRNIDFHLDSGKVIVTAVRREKKEI